jgi:tellurite resistance-related uncharacterized protein
MIPTLILAVLLLTACASAAAPSPSYDAVSPSMNLAGGVAPSAPAEQKSLAPSVSVEEYQAVSNSPGFTTAQAQERIVIQNADLAIVVKDPQAKMLEIGALAKRLGGFVVSSNMSQISIGNNLKVPDGSISIRVPAENLDSALTEIKANTIEIQSENRSGEDVTDRYVDLQSQLKAKEAAAAKLYEIMEQTQKADETLMIFNQLTQVQSEIEVLKGQIKYYEQASALSAISVRLIAEETIQPIVIAGWHPQGVASDAIQSLINFFQGFASFLIWLVIFIIPVAAVIIVMLALLWRLLRWFWRKVFPRKTPPPATPKAE